MHSHPARLTAEQRRKAILERLQAANSPLTGTQLAQEMQVSRQVIVQDIALLRASDHPILSTPQGYLYQSAPDLPAPSRHRQVIAVCHSYSQTREELNILVDHGLTVRDVIVEHPIYGEIRGLLMLHNRREVQQFMEQLDRTGANLLSALTDGVHLHTVEADSQEAIREACRALEKAGILLREED